MGVAPLTTTPSDSLAKCSLPVPVTLCSAGLQVLVQDLVPKGKMLPPRDTTMIPGLEVKTDARPLWAPHTSEQ